MKYNDVLVRSDAKKEGEWEAASKEQLDAYEEKYLKGGLPPYNPILALGSAAEERERFLNVPFIGVDERLGESNAFRTHGYTTIMKSRYSVLRGNIVLEVRLC